MSQCTGSSVNQCSGSPTRNLRLGPWTPRPQFWDWPPVRGDHINDRIAAPAPGRATTRRTARDHPGASGSCGIPAVSRMRAWADHAIVARRTKRSLLPSKRPGPIGPSPSERARQMVHRRPAVDRGIASRSVQRLRPIAREPTSPRLRWRVSAWSVNSQARLNGGFVMIQSGRASGASCRKSTGARP